MIQLTPHLRILVAVEPTDFRRGIDGLCGVCRQHLGTDPMSGTVFVFRSRRGHAVKVLVYDGQGFWLCQKRLSSGRFRYWPGGGRTRRLGRPSNSPVESRHSGATAPLEAHELAVLLACGDPEAARGKPPWRRLGEFPTPGVAFQTSL